MLSVHQQSKEMLGNWGNWGHPASLTPPKNFFFFFFFFEDLASLAKFAKFNEMCSCSHFFHAKL